MENVNEEEEEEVSVHSCGVEFPVVCFKKLKLLMDVFMTIFQLQHILPTHLACDKAPFRVELQYAFMSQQVIEKELPQIQCQCKC